jgi:tRNA uridine 5-carboxymethylaminomethyl modification enzyme
MLREDNADLRLMGKGHDLGLIDQNTRNDIKERKKQISKEIRRVKATLIKPSEEINAYLRNRGTKQINKGVYLDQLLKRAELDYQMVNALAKNPDHISPKVARQVEIEIKYEGYIHKQLREIEKFKSQESMKIPENLNFFEVYGLSNELKEKLSAIRPTSLGQASRIDGITPAALSVLMLAIKSAEKHFKVESA